MDGVAHRPAPSFAFEFDGSTVDQTDRSPLTAGRAFSLESKGMSDANGVDDRCQKVSRLPTTCGDADRSSGRDARARAAHAQRRGAHDVSDTAFHERLLRLPALELDRDARFIACLERGYPPEAPRSRYDPANLSSAVTMRMDQRLAQRYQNSHLGGIRHNWMRVAKLHPITVSPRLGAHRVGCSGEGAGQRATRTFNNPSTTLSDGR